MTFVNYLAVAILELVWHWFTIPALIFYAVVEVLGQWVRCVLDWQQERRKTEGQKS